MTKKSNKKTAKAKKADEKKSKYEKVVPIREEEDDDEIVEDSIANRKRTLIIEAVVLVVLFAIYIILLEFTVTNVYVEGNEHYDASEIIKVEAGMPCELLDVDTEEKLVEAAEFLTAGSNPKGEEYVYGK